MNDLRESGATIVFISHNLLNVTNFCERVLLLEKGKIIEEGGADDVVQKYRDLERKAALKVAAQDKFGKEIEQSDAVKAAAITSLELLNTNKEPTSEFEVDEPLVIRCEYYVHNPIEEPGYAIRIWRADGLHCTTIISPRDYSIDAHKKGKFEVSIGPLFLQPDFYSLNVFIFDRTTDLLHVSRSNVTFQLKGIVREGKAGVVAPNADWHEVTL